MNAQTAKKLLTALKNLVGLTEITGPNLHMYKAAIDDARKAIAEAELDNGT